MDSKSNKQLIRESYNRHRSEKLLDKSLFKNIKQDKNSLNFLQKVQTLKKKEAEKAPKKVKRKVNARLLLKKIWIDSKAKFEKNPLKNLQIWNKLLQTKMSFFLPEDFFLMQIFCILNDFLLSNSFISFESDDITQVKKFREEVISIYKLENANPQQKELEEFINEIPLIFANYNQNRVKTQFEIIHSIQKNLTAHFQNIKNCHKSLKNISLAKSKFYDLLNGLNSLSGFDLLKTMPQIEKFLESILENFSKPSRHIDLKIFKKQNKILKIDQFWMDCTDLIHLISHFFDNFRQKSKQSYLQKSLKILSKISIQIQKRANEVPSLKIIRKFLALFFMSINNQKQFEKQLLGKRNQIDQDLDVNTTDFKRNEILQNDDSKNESKDGRKTVNFLYIKIFLIFIVSNI